MELMLEELVSLVQTEVDKNENIPLEKLISRLILCVHEKRRKNLCSSQLVFKVLDIASEYVVKSCMNHNPSSYSQNVQDDENNDSNNNNNNDNVDDEENKRAPFLLNGRAMARKRISLSVNDEEEDKEDENDEDDESQDESEDDESNSSSSFSHENHLHAKRSIGKPKRYSDVHSQYYKKHVQEFENGKRNYLNLETLGKKKRMTVAQRVVMNKLKVNQIIHCPDLRSDSNMAFYKAKILEVDKEKHSFYIRFINPLFKGDDQWIHWSYVTLKGLKHLKN
jgi:hypothetical protein